MSVTPTYDSALSRVRVAATGLATTAAVALFERSTDQITWTTVRGGTAVPVVSNAASLDDYEFSPDVTNYYRVTTVKEPSFVAAGTAAHANNASVSPGLPAGLATGDLLLVLAAIRNSGTGVVDQPAGYTTIINGSNVKLFAKIAGAGESAPTVTFTGGVANADTSAQTAAFRDLQLSTYGATTSLNSSAQDISAPALSFDPVTEATRVWVGWKQDDWTSVAVVANGTEIGEPDTTTGDDQGIVWDYWIITTGAPFSISNVRTFAVTGGAAAISRGGTTMFRHANLVQTGSIIPTLTTAWIKSIGRPFLNTPVFPLKPIPIDESEPRHGVFEVIGRSDPVAKTDVRANKGYVLRLLAETDEERSRLDLLIDSGDPVFLHLPADFPKPSMYAVIGAKTFDPLNDTYTLPLRKVAPPGPDVVGATATWQTVINTYATWADVIAANATWADLLELVASPSEVIVP